MKRIDLHQEFIRALGSRLSRKDIVGRVADILLIEKDAAYRRLSGKVNFSVREMGVVCDTLGISIDDLMRGEDERIWLPFVLEHPMRARSMDSMFDSIDICIHRLGKIVGGQDPAFSGNIYSSLPLEYFLYSPLLTKFMFFKWGHYFVGSDEFNNFSEWELSPRADGLLQRLADVYDFESSYYIWDESLISLLCKEVANFYKMHVITDEEKTQIKFALKDMLNNLEQTLHGSYRPTVGLSHEGDFYVCPMHLGFTANYSASADEHFFTIQNNFGFCMVDNSPDSFNRLKNWVDSFRDISTLLSRSGRVERRLFFEIQHDTVDYLLGKDYPHKF